MGQKNRHRGPLRTLAVAMCILLALSPMAALSETKKEKKPATDKVYQQFVAERVRMIKQAGSFALVSVQDKAALDKILLDDGRLQEADAIINVVPGEGDFSRENPPYDAAMGALQKQLGVESSMLDGYTVGYSFVRQAGASKWQVVIYPWGPNPLEPYTVYRVEFASPSGEVLSCTKEQVEPKMLDIGTPVGATDKDISREDAVQKAKKALVRSRAKLTEDVLFTFAPVASLVENSGHKRFWIVRFESTDPVLNAYYGHFDIKLTARSGKVESIDGASNRELAKK